MLANSTTPHPYSEQNDRGLSKLSRLPKNALYICDCYGTRTAVEADSKRTREQIPTLELPETPVHLFC